MRVCLLIIALLLAEFCFGQQRSANRHNEVFAKIGKTSPDTSAARVYMDLAEYFLEQDSHEKLPMDSALRCIDAASSVAAKANLKTLMLEIQHLKARWYFKIHNFEEGSKIFLAQIQRYQKSGETDNEAAEWYEYGRALKFWDGTGNLYKDILSDGSLLYDDYKEAMLANFEKASALAKQNSNKRLLALILLQKVTYHLHYGDYKIASEEVPLLAELQQFTNIPKIYDLRVLQVKIANWSYSDYAAAVKYGLEAIRFANDDHHPERVIQCYGDIGYADGQIGNKEESVAGWEKYISELRKYNSSVDPIILRYYIPTLIFLHRSKEAREVLNSFDVNSPEYDTKQKIIIYEAAGNVNTDLRDFPAAQANYFKALKLTESDIHLVKNKRGAVNENLATMYVKWQKYEAARPYAEEVLDKQQDEIGGSNVAYIHMLLFKIDSASGNYPSAISHLKTAYTMRNSLAVEDTKKAIADLNIKYQTTQKEKDIQGLNNKVRLEKAESAARKKNVELLNSSLNLQQLQAATKEKNLQLMAAHIRLQQSDSVNRVKDIKMLSSDAQLQRTELQKSSLIRNITFGGVLLLLIILGLLYNQSRIIRRSNALEKGNNATLKQLVNEKEVLIKEIHHRVKNNLQMIMSLLESQSAFLEDDALVAIQSSQHRVQAMSLIHQKLYLNDELANISMKGYLRELVTYLEESFNTRRNIYFNMDLYEIDMDIAQAVPLGLIVNEAVTNAIKYAFPDGKRGQISITLKRLPKRLIELSISDNGIGFQKENINNNRTLGLRLIKGLSDNLEAKLEILAERGTTISVLFSGGSQTNNQ
jgi:two-component system, sensor histidine kinase PdtaS